MPSPIEIRPASTIAELQKIYRFRYSIYVEEMHRPQVYADHANRLIEDPLDAHAQNIVAWQADEPIAVVRVNLSREGPVGMYEDFYGMTEVGSDHPDRTAIVTRLMMRAEFRHTHLAANLCVACYRYGRARGVRWCFIDCNDPLVRFFTALGFIEHLPVAEHPEYGGVHRFRLDTEDAEHLRRLRSPFYDECLRHRSSSMVA